MKEKPSFNSYLATALLSIAGSIQYGKLKKASRNPRKASEQTLRRILRNGKDTEYGRLHDFDYILAAKDDVELYRRYAEKVKVSDYEDFRPFIERHKNGEADVLVPGHPYMYATTSGTTSEPKWVPITDVYLKNVYGKMTKV